MPPVELLDPTGKPQPREARLAIRPESLRGRRVGLLDNGKAGANMLLDRVEELLRSQYGVDTFVRRRKETATRGAAFLPELAAQAQVVIGALGD
jgi:hypothetical protein